MKYQKWSAFVLVAVWAAACRSPDITIAIANTNGGQDTVSKGGAAPVDSIAGLPGSISVTSSVSGCVGATYKLAPVAYSGGLSVQAAFTFAPDNTLIASVSSDGVVSGVSPGTTRVRVSVGSVWKDVTVNVSACGSANHNVVITVNPSPGTGTPGSTATVTASGTVDGVPITSGTWTSSNASFVSVSASTTLTATITFVAVGAQQAICLHDPNGFGQGCGFYTTVPAATNPTPINLGGPYTISACSGTTLQLPATPVAVTWVSNNSVATVSSSGLVTVGSSASAGGTTVISAVPVNASSGYATGTATITYIACNTGSTGPTSLSVSPSSVVLLLNQVQILTVTPIPAGSVTSLTLSITQNNCGSISIGADLLHPVLKALTANCSGVVTVTAQNGVSASMTFSTIAGTVTCSFAPADGTSFKKLVSSSAAASCTSPTGKVYRPFWSSTIPTTMSIDGSDGFIMIGGVNFPVGTTATLNALNLGDVTITVQPEITDGAPSDKVSHTFHVIP